MINVGIIGASFARDAYLPAFGHIEGARVVALASGRIDSARAAAKPYGIDAVYDDWKQMLSDHSLDLVCIRYTNDHACADDVGRDRKWCTCLV